jgi:hypothetical protein
MTMPERLALDARDTPPKSIACWRGAAAVAGGHRAPVPTSPEISKN